MLRVLLVDDEPIVRLALREMIDWHTYGCEIVGEAANGRDAFSLMKAENVDLAIVDIQMPVMTGIQLIKQIRESELKDIGIVMLSAYSNFDYVREAFLYGALDYIIKDDMSPDSVGEVLSRVVESMQDRKTERKRQQAENMSRSEQQKEKALVEMINGTESNTQIAEFTLLEGQRNFVLQLLVDNHSMERTSQIDERTSRFIVRAILQVFTLQSIYCVISARGEGSYVGIVSFSASMGDQTVHSQLNDLLTRAIKQVKEYVNISLSIGISTPSSRISHWSKQYEEASRQAELRFFNGHGRIYFAQVEQDKLIAYTKPNWTTLLEYIASHDARWEAEASELFRTLKQSSNGRYEDWMLPYRALVWELESLLYAHGVTFESLGVYHDHTMPESPLRTLECFDYIEPLHEWIFILLRASTEQLNPLKQLKDATPRMTEKVKMWIDKHYREPISLTAASEMAGVSESYLSKVFSKEIGETFIEYITRKRIDAAIQLMQSGMRLYEISERVGYPNQGYFSKMFKKVTGRSPNEYRELGLITHKEEEHTPKMLSRTEEV